MKRIGLGTLTDRDKLRRLIRGRDGNHQIPQTGRAAANFSLPTA